MAGVEQATDMAWGPGGATLRSTGTYWDGPRGEPGMTLRRARCPRTEGAGCVLRAIRTESGDMSCAKTSGPPRARCLSHELRLDFAECTTTDEVWTGHIPTPHLLVFAWRTVGTRPVRCALSPQSCARVISNCGS